MKITVSKATERQLDWLVAKCLGAVPATDTFHAGLLRWPGASYSESAPPYTTDPFVGYPITDSIEGLQLKVWLESNREGKVQAEIHSYDGDWIAFGPTILIAVLRCYVASKLGEEVEVPDECF